MGLFDKLFGGKGRSDAPAKPVAAQAREVQPAPPPKAQPAQREEPAPEPEPTQEELIETALKSYDFGGLKGREAIPAITDMDGLRKISSSARHPSVRTAAKKRLEVLRDEKRAQAKRYIAGITSQDELAALAENEDEDRILREVAAKAVTDQAILKRWAMERKKGSFFVMLKRISNPADLVDIARDATDPKTRAAATGLVKDAGVLKDMACNGWGDRATALEKLGGYACASCDATVLPEGDSPVVCICPNCGTANHDWFRVNNVVEYRDYEVGEWHDECSRCGETSNHHSVNTWSEG